MASFGSLREYGRALLSTPRRLVERGAAVGSEQDEARESGAVTALWSCSDTPSASLRRQLKWYDVVCIGVGGMVGAGIFVTTGKAAHDVAGPAVILSYLVAGIAALLSALCYSDFAAHVPAAGGAFSYLRITFGELAAYLTGANLIMEYVISNAAVSRSFTSYLATTFGVDNPDLWRVRVQGISAGYNLLDFPAVALIIILTICICWSTKQSSTFNVVLTFFHLALIAFIIGAGFAKGSPRNLTTPANHQSSPGGFAPFGARGVLNGAALVYFSFIGYDTVSTMAEEVHKPAKTMPLGIAGSVLLVTAIYCLMAAAIVMLLPYDQIDVTAPFSLALRQTAGWKWASNVVGLGASVGILSSLMVAMMGQARYLCVIGRANVIPSWFANVNPRTMTPLNSTIVLGACTAIVALFTEMEILLDLISIGTLFVFYMVANALIFRRHVHNGITNPWPTLMFLFAISGLSIGFVAIWHTYKTGALNYKAITGLTICGGAIVALTSTFKAMVPPVDRPTKKWEAPLMPFLAVSSVFCNIFLAGSIRVEAFIRFGIWSAAVLLFYLFYSLHASQDAYSGNALSKAGQSCAQNTGAVCPINAVFPGDEVGEMEEGNMIPPSQAGHRAGRIALVCSGPQAAGLHAIQFSVYESPLHTQVPIARLSSSQSHCTLSSQ